MGEMFGNLYCLFETFFGVHLAEYLWGYDGSDYNNPNLFLRLGICTLALSALWAIAYYYIINHPRFNRWGSWMIVMGLNAIIAFLIAYSKTVNDLKDGLIPEGLLSKIDESGAFISDCITVSDCRGFGLANFFVSIIFFVALSFLMKRGSRNCKHSPC